ncbi:MAG: hypothetical protein GXX96_08235 [Planctomycetaceae bacterium]|nr:hypothetical protein [Planctomycetaceae bacterium]
MLANGRHVAVILFIGLVPFTIAHAADDLAAQAQAAKGTYRPLDQADLDAARADLDAAVAALETRFAKAGDTADGWKAYLDWAGLKASLADAKGPDLAKLEQAFSRLSAGHEGLGLLCFADLRDAIRGYVGVARAVGDSGVKGQYEKVVDALAASLASHAKAPGGEDAAMISAYLRWLSDARQAPDLIQSIRSGFLNQNFHAHISEAVFNAAMGRDVDETEPVRDVILGTNIYGTGRTTGNVTVKLVPSQDSATIMTILQGTNLSNTTGYNGPVVIYADGTTNITTSKQIVIDGRQLRTCPAQADATTCSHIRSICARHGGRIVENIAWKRAGRQKCQADAIAAQHAECRVRARIDAEVDDLIGTANDDLQEKVRGPLAERGLYPAKLNFSTDEDFLNVSILQAGAFDLAAATAPPQAVADADLRVQIHESMINNFTSGALAGMLLREERVQEAVKNLLGKLPKELESEKDSLPWGISFQQARPVWVAFADNQFTLSIRGRSFYEGDQRHPGMDVTVTYRIVGEGDAVKAVRQGDVQIFPPGFDPKGDKQLTTQETAIRRILQRRLGKLFEEEVVPEGLVLPKDWRRAGVMKLVQWEARDGWLVLAWKRTGQPAPPLEDETTKVVSAQ